MERRVGRTSLREPESLEVLFRGVAGADSFTGEVWPRLDEFDWVTKLQAKPAALEAGFECLRGCMLEFVGDFRSFPRSVVSSVFFFSGFCSRLVSLGMAGTGSVGGDGRESNPKPRISPELVIGEGVVELRFDWLCVVDRGGKAGGRGRSG